MRRQQNVWPFSSRATSGRQTMPASARSASSLGIPGRTAKRVGKSSRYKGYSITPYGEGYRTNLDESEFDTLSDAKRFIDSYAKGRNPGVTDRAHRYRAQNNVTGPKVCVLCGARQDIGVMHLDGNESHDESANLAYGCRSCNGILAAAFKRIGAGRPTNQYNPVRHTIPSFEQYAWAVSNHTDKAHDEGGAIIHATPKYKRIEYARRIAGLKAQRSRARDDERWNPSMKKLLRKVKAALPSSGKRRVSKALRKHVRGNPAEGAVEMSERFHGRPVEEIIDVTEDIHVHEHLAELGELHKLKVKAPDGVTVTLTDFGGAILCSNEDGTQLYIRAGDQAVDLSEFAIEEPYHDVEDLGEVVKIWYYTVKHHLGKEGGEAVYFHEFGEEDKEKGARPRRPRLKYSTRDERLSFAGGGYVVEPEGIRN